MDNDLMSQETAVYSWVWLLATGLRLTPVHSRWQTVRFTSSIVSQHETPPCRSKYSGRLTFHIPYTSLRPQQQTQTTLSYVLWLLRSGGCIIIQTPKRLGALKQNTCFIMVSSKSMTGLDSSPVVKLTGRSWRNCSLSLISYWWTAKFHINLKSLRKLKRQIHHIQKEEMKQLMGVEEGKSSRLSPKLCHFSFAHNLIARTSCDHWNDLFPHVWRTGFPGCIAKVRYS